MGCRFFRLFGSDFVGRNGGDGGFNRGPSRSWEFGGGTQQFKGVSESALQLKTFALRTNGVFPVVRLFKGIRDTKHVSYENPGGGGDLSLFLCMHDSLSFNLVGTLLRDSKLKNPRSEAPPLSVRRYASGRTASSSAREEVIRLLLPYTKRVLNKPDIQRHWSI